MPRPAETERIVGAIRDYLDRHEAGDSKAASLRRDDIANACRVGKRHLSRTDDPELAALAERIQRLERRQSGPQRTSDEPANFLGLPYETRERDPDLRLEDLTGDVARRQTDIAYRLRQWLAYHENPGEVLDSPVMLADLESLIGGLHRIADELRPLIATVNRFRVDIDNPINRMPLLAAAECASPPE